MTPNSSGFSFRYTSAILSKGLGWLMFAGLWQFAVVGGLRRDGDDYAWAEFIVGFMVLLAILCFVFSFWPRKRDE